MRVLKIKQVTEISSLSLMHIAIICSEAKSRKFEQLDLLHWMVSSSVYSYHALPFLGFFPTDNIRDDYRI